MMEHQAKILNLLLDRYERSGHCLPEKSSNRRIALNMARGEYSSYRENDPSAAEINETVRALAEDGLVSFTWRKGFENWLLDKVYLELGALSLAYLRAGRTPLPDTADLLRQLIRRAKDEIQAEWKLQFLEDELSKLQKNLHTSRLLPEDIAQAEAVLKVLQYTEQGPELMRVISTNCFYDSKYLERNLLSKLASIAKVYEPELVAYRVAEEDFLTQKVVLEQIGILTYPEIFEFCGSVHLVFPKTSIDTRSFRKGFCLQSENLGVLSRITLDEIRTVLFVENRTNYRYLLLHGIPDDMLVIFHGGFYSPTKRQLFQMLADALPASAETQFWGDIDLGGFLMFTRLKNGLFPMLTPYRMDLDNYESYRRYGTERKFTYLASLRQRMNGGAVDPVFVPVVQAILTNEVTIEQEIML